MKFEKVKKKGERCPEGFDTHPYLHTESHTQKHFNKSAFFFAGGMGGRRFGNVVNLGKVGKIQKGTAPYLFRITIP